MPSVWSLVWKAIYFNFWIWVSLQYFIVEFDYSDTNIWNFILEIYYSDTKIYYFIVEFYYSDSYKV